MYSKDGSAGSQSNKTVFVVAAPVLYVGDQRFRLGERVCEDELERNPMSLLRKGLLKRAD
jgi:hypothetical protein